MISPIKLFGTCLRYQKVSKGFLCTLQISKSPSEMRDLAARICRDYLTGAWKTVSADEIKLKRISGGLSNYLYYVSLPDSTRNSSRSSSISASSTIPTEPINLIPKRPRKGSADDFLRNGNLYEPREVLLRIYGHTHGEQALETMLTETVVFALLSERKLGPKLHGIFPGGRIEQYIPARALRTPELSNPRISARIAEKTAEIHSLNIPVSKEPDWLWSTMDRWLKTADSVLCKFQPTSPDEAEQLEKLRKINFRAEMNWFQRIVRESPEFPVVFSHNDLQEGNILFKDYESVDRRISDDTDMPHFSDGLNANFQSILLSAAQGDSAHDPTTLGEDNGNAMGQMSRKRSLNDNEDSIGGELDNTRDSVLSGNSQMFSDSNDGCDPELMIIDFEYCSYNYRGFDFANHFIEWTFDYISNENYPFYVHKPEQFPNQEQREHFISAYLRRIHNDDEYKASDEEMHEIQKEIDCFTMASHLFWALWSIVNVYQEIEFGYWHYASCRIDEYFRAKRTYQTLYRYTNDQDRE
ncbi:choline/ethanolamine kinase isoform X2 [Lutzomyia longipalpis]|uniref:choline/ethanolamine kinase isoform X2 n=1 Tax=Lutzomyia longipalpis TaxID=7200 RepID=UPI0024841DFA|nr:choline/ethanolamine kinase isoform X2 [Lutzomyia longipalpis]